MNAQAIRIFVVDDNRSAANALAKILSTSGDQVEVFYEGQSAIDALPAHLPHLILTDLKMEPVDGLAVVEGAQSLRPRPEVIVFTAYGDVNTAVEAMKSGARDFLTKPVRVELLKARIEEVRQGLFGEPAPSPTGPSSTFDGSSQAIEALSRKIQLVSSSKSNVWLCGEPGTGRLRAARMIHRFTNVELPFTTWTVGRNQPWPLKGTVLLRDVDRLPLDLQNKLLLELPTVPDGVRVIATAGVDARQKLASGQLLADLYYQLSVLTVEMPALRHRSEDVLTIFDSAVAWLSEQQGIPVRVTTDEQRTKLMQHAWPGNAKELLNVAERFVLFGEQALAFDMAPRTNMMVPLLEEGFSLSQHMDHVEYEILRAALEQCGGDRGEAGKILGVERNALRYKLKKHGLLSL